MGAEDYEVTWVDTADSPRNADQKRTKYAGMIAKNGLADRYSMDILTLTVFGVEEHRIMLIDSRPSEPVPEFLKDPEFVLKRSREHKRHVPDHDFYTGEQESVPRGRVKRMIRGAEYAYGGESHTLKEWADLTGIPYTALYQRLVRSSWAIGEALTRPVEKKNRKAS